MPDINVTIPQTTVNVDITTEQVNVSTTAANIIVGETTVVTNAIIRGAISAVDAGGDGSFSYNAVTGVFTYTGPNQTEANARITAAPLQVRGHLSVTDAGGDGSLSYNSTTGVFTYTGPSASEVRAHLSNVDPVLYNSTTGVISLNNTTLLSGQTTDNLTEGSANLYFTYNNANTWLATKTTTDLAEGTNLYWTTDRGNTNSNAWLTTKTTTDLTEGANLYFTTNRANSAANAYITAPFTYQGRFNKTVIDKTDPAINEIYTEDIIDEIKYSANVSDSGASLFQTNLSSGDTPGRELQPVIVRAGSQNQASNASSLLKLFNTVSVRYNTKATRAYNNTGGGLYPGQIVYVDGYLANTVPTVNLASATTANTATNIGVVMVDSGYGGFGEYTTILQDGDFSVINHTAAYGNWDSTWKTGQEVYLSDTTGQVTSTPGTNLIRIGKVVGWRVDESDTNQPRMIVRVGPIGKVNTLFETLSPRSLGGTIDLSSATLTGPVSITGNVDIAGNLNYQNVTDLYVKDQSITLNANAITNANVQIVANEPNWTYNPDIKFNIITGRWEFNNGNSAISYYHINSNADVVAHIATVPLTVGGNLDVTGATNLNSLNVDGITVLGNDLNSNANITTTANINAAGGTLTGAVTSSGNITTTANIQANYIIADTRFEGDINGAIQAEVWNASGVTLNKGDIVALTGTNHGDTPDVTLADYGNASLMPGFGVVKNSIAPTATGEVVISGRMNFAGHGFPTGAQLYVNGTGQFTATAPEGEANLLQKIATVTNSNTINVAGAGRTNATPNLNKGNIFIGDVNNRSVTAKLDTSIVPEAANTRFRYYDDAKVEAYLSTGVDNNIVAGNIKQSASILSVYGSAGWGGGTDYVQLSVGANLSFPAGTEVTITGIPVGNQFYMLNNKTFYLGTEATEAYPLYYDAALTLPSQSGLGNDLSPSGWNLKYAGTTPANISTAGSVIGGYLHGDASNVTGLNRLVTTVATEDGIFSGYHYNLGIAFYGSAGYGAGTDYIQLPVGANISLPSGTKVILKDFANATVGAVFADKAYWVGTEATEAYPLYEDAGLTTPSQSGLGNDLSSIFNVYSANLITSNIDVNGNLIAGYLHGDGSNITGIGSSYSNADVLNYLSSGTYVGSIYAGDSTFATTQYFNFDGLSLLTANDQAGGPTVYVNEIKDSAAGVGPYIRLRRRKNNLANVANGDVLGGFVFSGPRDVSLNNYNYAQMYASAPTVQNGKTKGKLHWTLRNLAAFNDVMSLDNSELATVSTVDIHSGKDIVSDRRIHSGADLSARDNTFAGYTEYNATAFYGSAGYGGGQDYIQLEVAQSANLPSGTKIWISAIAPGDLANSFNSKAYWVGTEATEAYPLFEDAGLTVPSASGLGNDLSTNYSVYTESTSTNAGNLFVRENVYASYLYGDGSNITGIAGGGGNAFGIVSVAGQSNVVADASTDQITFVAGSGMTLTTNAVTSEITFTSSGGYSNTDVQTWLASGNNAGNIATSGNLIISGSAGNVVQSVNSYFGNVNTGNYDQIELSPDPGLSNGDPILFANTTNPNLTFLNGNVYYAKVEGGGFYGLFNDAPLTSSLQSGLGSESPSGLTGEFTGVSDISATVAGTLSVTGVTSLATNGGNTTVGGNITTGSTGGVYVGTRGINAIGGGTITINSVRVTDFKANDPLALQTYANTALGGVSGFAGSLIFVSPNNLGGNFTNGQVAFYDGTNWRFIHDGSIVT